MDRLRKSSRLQFETENGRMEEVRVWFRYEDRPAIIVGNWQCPADIAEEARKWVPQWGPLATQVFLEAEGERNGEIEDGLPDSLQYFERLRVTDHDEYKLARVDLEWESDCREYVQRQWKVRTFTREWLDIRKEADGHPQKIVAVTGEGS